MREQFKKEDGYYIIEVGNETYYMRSHPMDMYSAMEMKEWDRFITFTEAKPKNGVMVRDEVIFHISQLKEYILKIHNKARRNEK